jgi:hypothetical protein
MKFIDMINASLATRKAQRDLNEAKVLAESATMRAAAVIESVSKIRIARKVA